MHQGTVGSGITLNTHAAIGAAAFAAWPNMWGFVGMWPQPWWGVVYQRAWQNALLASAAPKRLQVRAEDWPHASRN